MTYHERLISGNIWAAVRAKNTTSLFEIWASACCVKDVYDYVLRSLNILMLVVNFCMFVLDFLFVKHLDKLVCISNV